MTKQPSQKVLVLRHLVRYGSITDKVARDKYGITRLAARVWDIRDDINAPGRPALWFDIYTLDVKFKTRLGRKGVCAKYMVKEYQRQEARTLLKELEGK